MVVIYKQGCRRRGQPGHVPRTFKRGGDTSEFVPPPPLLDRQTALILQFPHILLLNAKFSWLALLANFTSLIFPKLCLRLSMHTLATYFFKFGLYYIMHMLLQSIPLIVTPLNTSIWKLMNSLEVSRIAGFFKYKKRLLLRCIHHFKSDLINNMDHMHIPGT